jgi:hypothetical protein
MPSLAPAPRPPGLVPREQQRRRVPAPLRRRAKTPPAHTKRGPSWPAQSELGAAPWRAAVVGQSAPGEVVAPRRGTQPRAELAEATGNGRRTRTSPLAHGRRARGRAPSSRDARPVLRSRAASFALRKAPLRPREPPLASRTPLLPVRPSSRGTSPPSPPAERAKPHGSRVPAAAGPAESAVGSRRRVERPAEPRRQAARQVA